MEPTKPISGSSSAKPPAKEPWPMWPIALSIAAFVVFYTWVQLSFRKEETPFEPHRAMVDRQKAVVETNLYGWHSLKPTPADETSGSIYPEKASISTRLADQPLEELLPEQLVYYLPRPPILVEEVVHLQAPSAAIPGDPYPISFELPNAIALHPDLAFRAFYKEDALHIFLEWNVEDNEAIPVLEPSPPSRLTQVLPTSPFQGRQITAYFHLDGEVRSWNIELANAALAKEGGRS